MKVEDLCENVSQMGRNRAFSPLGHKRSLHERHGDRGFSKGIRRSPLGRHLSAMATESHKNNQVGSPLGVAMATSLASGDLVHSRHGRHLGSPWRP
jgi:hypothetical protein